MSKVRRFIYVPDSDGDQLGVVGVVITGQVSTTQQNKSDGTLTEKNLDPNGNYDGKTYYFR